MYIGSELYGDPNESLRSLRENANKHRDWRDGANYIFGNDVTNMTTQQLSEFFKNRQIDENGRVVVEAFDALIGRSQPELQAAYEKYRQTTLKNSSAVRNTNAARAQLGIGLKPITVDHTVQPENIEAAAQAQEALSKNIGLLQAKENGPQALAELIERKGGNITNSDVLSTTSILDTKNAKPGKERAAAIHDDNLKTSKSQREATAQSIAASKESVRASQANTALNAVIAENNQKTAEYERDYRDAKLKFEQDESARLYAFQAQEGNANRQLQFQLADMNRQERNEDRDARERREDRDRRQLMILQLMKGLKELGQRFSL